MQELFHFCFRAYHNYGSRVFQAYFFITVNEVVDFLRTCLSNHDQQIANRHLFIILVVQVP